MKTALVTGSSGFVGRHMCAELQRRDYDVVEVDIEDGGDALVTFKHSDKRFDLVVHAAAVNPFRSAIDKTPSIFAQNMHLDSAMFDWAIKTRQRHVLYLSSCAVYPIVLCKSPNRLMEDEIDLDYPENPDSTYGITKLTGEQLARSARACDVPVTVVRPFSGYGEDQNANWPFGAFAQRAQNHESPFTVWGSAEQTRDWIHISDVVRGALAVVDSNIDLPVNLCTGQATSMGDLALMMMNHAGYDATINVDRSQPMGVRHRIGDPSRFFEFYEPRVSIEEGVARALKLRDA